MMKTLVLAATMLAVLAALTACERDADVASDNLSAAADNFEVTRRIIFYNGITDTYMLTIEGLCSLEIAPSTLRVTCKVGPNAYKKHYLGLSDNVTYFVEQIEPNDVSVYYYDVTFKPSVIIPDVRM